tara:strand:- start:3161 stop:6607 length:3447 start_codon:yes stop_codon:yes gene_type:complete
MLNPSDVYVEGGSNDLLVCWTDKVTKYDASSFYNWEMDNLPLHDLDERTHLLWERLGHPTSSITGMSFIVSADATSSCSPLYFTTLSSCLEAIPEVINCPILVEVASFGDLGSLDISNKVFGPRGAIEIINRNCGFAGAVDLGNTAMSFGRIDTGFDGYGLASSVSSLFTVSAPSVSFDNFNSYMYSNGQFLASTTDKWKDERFDNPGHYVFTRRVGSDQLGVMTASLSSAGSPWGTRGTDNLADASKYLTFIPHDKTYRSEELMETYDASTVSEITGGSLYPNAEVDVVAPTPGDEVAAFSYLNHLDSIKITNCDGPIYIRNFTVDGENTRAKGIEISNSNVNLERCSASRCTQAGLHATNSKVNLLRGFVAFRNYGFEGGVRVGLNWNEKVESYKTLDSYGAGIYADNSTIDFQSTYVRDLEKSSQASSLIYPASYTGDLPVPSQEALYCLSRNDIGIHAINSTFTGGRTEVETPTSAAVTWQNAVQIFSELNTEAGVRLSNCSLNLKGRLTTYGNYYGIDALNTDMSFDFLKAYANQKDALKLDGCSLKYNNNLYRGYLDGLSYTSNAFKAYLQHQVTLLLNGGAINAKNSTIGPVYTSAMPDIYESFFVSGTHGVYKSADDTKNAKPNVILDGSHLDAIHASIYTEPTLGGRTKACFGEAIHAKNGSVVYLRGSGSYANKIIGGETSVAQHRKSGLYATDNSKISIQGPTVIAQFGIDALVNNNSELEICPPRDSEGSLLASSFNLDESKNHTMVEMHSTRACIVADNGSVVNAEDLGSYHDLWGVGTYGSDIDLTRLDYLTSADTGTDQYVTNVSAGSLQLYPNAFLTEGDIPFAAPGLTSKAAAFGLGGYTAQNYYYLYNINNGGDFNISGVTTGGMSVRAVNKSKINVTNVHFPTGWVQTSSVIYDFSGIDGLDAACTRPHIWNIADDSVLDANYISVSGSHPQDAGYVGPSGNWYLASGAPDSTPDTSSLSVLDYYGPDDDNQNIFGASSAKNYGAFRLYFSVDPLANSLVVPVDVVSGYASQVFAQGYNFSGSLSAPGDVSAFQTKALFSPSYYTISDAGFYYASSMVYNPNTVKAFLDDSAANTFANSKHNAVGKSGLANTVRIYEPFDTGFGGDSVADKTSGRGIASVNKFDLRKLN